MISIKIGVSVALIEIMVGILAGNFFGIHTNSWIDFLATFGSGLLTFLAGAEIDPASLRRHLKPALAIGTNQRSVWSTGAWFSASRDLRAQLSKRLRMLARRAFLVLRSRSKTWVPYRTSHSSNTASYSRLPVPLRHFGRQPTSFLR
ncbi:MAG: cation:proton antiporter [Gemmatimonadaceae bacterium]